MSLTTSIAVCLRCSAQLNVTPSRSYGDDEISRFIGTISMHWCTLLDEAKPGHTVCGLFVQELKLLKSAAKALTTFRLETLGSLPTCIGVRNHEQERRRIDNEDQDSAQLSALILLLRLFSITSSHRQLRHCLHSEVGQIFWPNVHRFESLNYESPWTQQNDQ